MIADTSTDAALQVEQLGAAKQETGLRLFRDGRISAGLAALTVVADSTPLLYLASLSRFEIFRSLFAEVVIPEGVHREAIVQAR